MRSAWVLRLLLVEMLLLMLDLNTTRVAYSSNRDWHTTRSMRVKDSHSLSHAAVAAHGLTKISIGAPRTDPLHSSPSWLHRDNRNVLLLFVGVYATWDLNYMMLLSMGVVLQRGVSIRWRRRCGIDIDSVPGWQYLSLQGLRL
jgi:hypothetical protein